MTGTITRTAAPAVRAIAATLVLAAICWVFAVRQMIGMDMGPETELGSFASFAPLWVSMMAAMMLPAAAPAIAGHRAVRGRRSVPLFVASYLAVWALVGLLVYALYRAHGTEGAGAVVIAAGLYELTPVKRHFRERCRERFTSGLEFGACCVGSSAGLMAILVALGVMSIAWMSAVAVVVLVQKLLPPRAVLDIPVALAILGLGLWLVTNH